MLPLQISDTITGLQLSVSGPLTTMEELFTGSKPFLVSTRNCRRLSENVINLLSSISLAQSSVVTGLGNDTSISGASIIPLTPVPPSVAPTVVPTGGLMPSPFSPGWAANTLMVNEDYRWGCRPVWFKYTVEIDLCQKFQYVSKYMVHNMIHINVQYNTIQQLVYRVQKCVINFRKVSDRFLSFEQCHLMLIKIKLERV